MALCKFCGVAFAWGNNEGKWTPLVPLGEEGDLRRTYQDEQGNLRASHTDICVNRGGPTVRVSRLAKAVEANEILRPTTYVNIDSGEIVSHEGIAQQEPKRRGRPRKQR